MKQFASAAVLALGLVACGESPTNTLKTACIDEFQDNTACGCMADAAEEQLDPALLKKLASAVKEGESGVDQLSGDLTEADQAKILGFVFGAAMTCGLNING